MAGELREYCMSNKEIVTVFFLRVIGSTLIGVMMANSVLKPTVSIQLFLDFGLVVLVLTVLEVVGFDWLNRGRSRRAGLPAFGNLTTQVGLTLVSGLAFGLFFLLLAGIIALFKVFIHDFNAPFSLFIIDLVFIIFLGIVGGALGFIAALYFGLTQNRPVTWFSDLIAHHRWRLLLVIGGVLVGFYLLVTITSGSQDTGATIAATVAFTAVLVLFAATLSMGSSFGQTIREWFVAFGAVGPKLWDRRKPLAGYTLQPIQKVYVMVK